MSSGRDSLHVDHKFNKRQTEQGRGKRLIRHADNLYNLDQRRKLADNRINPFDSFRDPKKVF